MEDQPMYTLQAAANLLAVSEKTVRRRIKNGEIAASLIGDHYRIRASELDRYIEANRIYTNGESA